MSRRSMYNFAKKIRSSGGEISQEQLQEAIKSVTRKSDRVQT